MKQDKYLQIFNYLHEFSKLRSNPVRDIDNSETQYPEKLWLDDIPVNELFENVIRPEFNQENDYWIKIKKPKEPIKPDFPILPKKIQTWVDQDSLLSEENEPFLKETIEENNKTLLLVDFPEINIDLKKYVNEKWLDDLIAYNIKLKKYQEEYEIFEKLNDTYKKLFYIYNKTQQFGEEYELVVGVGLLNFKENEERPKIFRHIITQKVDINFEYSNQDSQIYITQNIESIPQIETDSIIDLYEQFDSQNIIDAEKAVDSYIKEKEIDQLFFEDNLMLDALQIFADRVSPDGKFINSLQKPVSTQNKPTIYFAPALLLRKRNTQSLTALYEKILENIKDAGAEMEIPSIDDLIGIQKTKEDNNLNPDLVDFETTKNEPIYFPKEYNDEQIEIIEKAKKNNKVLVQGPPGTGKSHTIANLICHLLANGKKVLVTAYTSRALKVLKDKLPEEFQDLTVNLLSSDSSSLQDLQKSVNSINNELSSANLNDYQKIIEQLSEELSETREKIAYNTNEIIKIKEKSTRKQEINSAYVGTLTEIAEKLESESTDYEWYKDSFDDIDNQTIINDLQKFIVLNDKYKNIDVNEFDYLIPEVENIPTIDQLKQYKKTINDLTSYDHKENNYLQISCNDYAELKSMLSDLDEFYKEANNLQIDCLDKIITSFLKGNADQWHEKIESALQIIERLEKNDFKQIDRDIEITYNSSNSLKQLKNDAQRLLDYITKGNSLEGISFAMKKSFLSKELKESLYFIESVKVNGSNCDKISEFKSVINDISFQQDFEELSELLELEIPVGKSYFNKFTFFKNKESKISRLIEIIENSEQLRKEIEKTICIDIVPFDKPSVDKLIIECEYNFILKTIEEFKEMVKKSEEYLKQANMHPVVSDILRDFREINDLSYKETLNLLYSISQKKIEYEEFREIRNNIQNIFPNLVEDISSGNFTKEKLFLIKDAFYFLNAKNEINKIMDIDYEKKLLIDLNAFQKKEKDLIAKLASKKAWSIVIEGLQQNRSLRQHLEAWVLAVKKIGKTGKGKRALKFKRVAQQEMEGCKNSVPCWIMPLYKVAETISPEQGMYDYVIIDEASQLGPDAIFLLYISKNIIIVGDDKQTAPEYIGVDANTMTPHIQRYLKNIPYSDFYGTECSFFDYAKLFCEGMIVLREHFRCMPEIIEFSNKYFYAPEGKGLYPLKQYSENRLEPLMHIFCNNGYVEGNGSTIINKPEAKEICETIARLIDDKKYEGKTFGVITLQGNQQSKIIEDLLLKKIGELEFQKRKIICGNSASFQGDERDIIFLSLVTAHNHNRSALTKLEDERRFNVAVSRAIEQIWLFHSIEIEDLSNTNDLRYKLLDHFENYKIKQYIDKQLISVPKIKSRGTQPSPYDSWFEVEVRNDITSKGYCVIPQYEVAKGKYRIDLVTILPSGIKIAIECDGDNWHGAEQQQNDLMRQKVLERCGWQFFRIRGYEYYTDRVKALEPLWNLLQTTKLDYKNEEPKQETIVEGVISNDQENKSSVVEMPLIEDNIKANISKIDSTTIKTSDENILNESKEILIFTNQYNVYKLQNNDNNDIQELIEKIEFDPEEKPIYITGTKDYSGYLIVAFENGKVGKILMKNFETNFNRKKLMNAFNNESKLLYIQQIKDDVDLVIVSNLNKVIVFNTSKINPVESRNTKGIQIMRSKNKSVVLEVKNIDDVKINDVEYYRKNCNQSVVGYYLKQGDFVSDNHKVRELYDLE